MNYEEKYEVHLHVVAGENTLGSAKSQRSKVFFLSIMFGLFHYEYCYIFTEWPNCL